MTLQKYIEDLTPQKFAKIFKVDVSVAYRYMNFKTIPAPSLAKEISDQTNGLVDYRDCYEPYFKHLESSDKKQLKFKEV